MGSSPRAGGLTEVRGDRCAWTLGEDELAVEGPLGEDELAVEGRLSAPAAPAAKETRRARCSCGERDLCTSARAVCAVNAALSPRRIAGLVGRTCELESRAAGATLRLSELACTRAWDDCAPVELPSLSRTGAVLAALETPPTPFGCWTTPALGLAGCQPWDTGTVAGAVLWKVPFRRHS